MDLAGDWGKIHGAEPPPGEIPPARWSRPWSTHPLSAARLHQAVVLKKPRVLIETGTFEGLGTYVLARAAHLSGTPARIFTIDYDGDPEADIPEPEWARLKEIRAENLDRAAREFPTVSIEFVEGDSRQVLPVVIERAGARWDLFFQDSMHFTAGIRSEWAIAKPHAGDRALVIFDDVCMDWKKLPRHLFGHPDFCLGFALKEGLLEGWTWRSTATGRAQFFAQKP